MTQDSKQETRRASPQTGGGIFAWMRDRLYDFVYSEGDFALQMVGDLFRGYEPARENKHLERQIKHREKRVSPAKPKQPPSKSQIHENPFTHKEKQAFVELLKRETGEGQIEYWKRKKWLLHLPSQTIRGMIADRETLKKQLATDDIEIESYNISQTYRQRLVDRETRKQMKKRVVAQRKMKRGKR